MRLDYIDHYLKIEEAETPSIRIKNVTFKNKKLDVTISDFLMKSGPEGKTGRIEVRVLIKNGRGRALFDQKRNIAANNHVGLGFDWLQERKFEISIEIKDLLTGKTDTKKIEVK